MVQNSHARLWIAKIPTNSLVWMLMATTLVAGNSEINDELDQDVGVGLSIGMGGEMNHGQDSVIGNNSVTAVQPGESARLACPIPAEMFGTKVSWIRRGDLQLLAVGDTVYTHDHRLFVSHSRHSHNSHHSQVWFLHLTNVTKSDEGEYECQTSTHPHVSIFTFLKVQNAYSHIEGPENRVVASGSPLRLVCTIHGASTPPSYVFWYHFERMINYDTSRGISVTKPTAFRSTLMISEATADYIGNYTCQPSNANPASVNVHVIVETTEPSATGRVGKKVSEKTPVRQLGVKSPTSTGSTLGSPAFSLTFSLFLATVLLVPSLLDFSSSLSNNNTSTSKPFSLKKSENNKVNVFHFHANEFPKNNSYILNSESFETKSDYRLDASEHGSLEVFQREL